MNFWNVKYWNFNIWDSKIPNISIWIFEYLSFLNFKYTKISSIWIYKCIINKSKFWNLNFPLFSYLETIWKRNLFTIANYKTLIPGKNIHNYLPICTYCKVTGVESWRVKLQRNHRKWSIVRPKEFFFYSDRQVQSLSPADIISVNVARVYPHTYLTNSSRAGPTSRSVACYLKKQSLSHEITFRPDCLVHCILFYLQVYLCYVSFCASVLESKWFSVSM